MNETTEMVSGEINKEPLKELKTGDKISFCPGKFNRPISTTSKLFSIWSENPGIVLALKFRNRDTKKSSIEGSAVMIGPGIALTAKHVFDDFMEQNLMSKSISITALGTNQEDLQIWSVTKLIPINNSDLAIICLDLYSRLPKDRTLNFATITTRLPDIGETVGISGFKSSDFDLSGRLGIEGLNFKGDVYLISGKITAVYPKGRDSVMLPWPVVEINCPSLGGMSGGPVFDKNGLVFGVLSSGFSSGSPSYCSLVWPSLTTKFEGGWPNSLFKDLCSTKSRNLVELNSHGLCRIDNLDAIVNGKDENGSNEWYIKY